MQLEVGTVLEGKVTGITGFGAFVALPDNKSGLIHISEIANTYVNDIHEYLSVGQSVKVRVMNISADGKIALSAKRAQEDQNKSPAPQRRASAQSAPARPQQPDLQRQASVPYVPTRSDDRNFEDKLKQFMQESDSKMSGNRLFEQQRKSRGRRK